MKYPRDYRHYVGGDWKWVQEFQMDYLNKCPDFSSSKRFLDLGCGSMRLGSKLIPELDAGKYIGLDFNEEIVKIGIEKEIEPEILENKNPTFIFNGEFDLTEVEGEVDFVWVYQVFIHVSDKLVQTALNNIANKLSDGGVVYATFTNAIAKRKVSDDYVYDQHQLTFYRTLEKIEEMFATAGLSLEKAGQTPKGGLIVKGTKL